MYSGDDTTLLAQVPSSLYQPISNFTRSEGCASSHLLGNKCTSLNDDIFCSSFKHACNDTGSLRKQRLAMHVNTRHMGLYHPAVLHNQHGTVVPAQNVINQCFPFQGLESESSLEGKQSKPISSSSSLEDAAAFTSKKIDVSSQNSIENVCTRDTMEVNVPSANSVVFGQNNSIIPSNTNTPTLSDDNAVTHTSCGQIPANSNALHKVTSSFHARQQKRSRPYDIFLPKPSKKPSIVPSKTRLPISLSNSRIHVATSNSQATVDHLNTRGMAHAEFLEGVQGWVDAIKCVCDVHKQQQEFELFGDEPTLIAVEPPDLLKLLKDIDQKKNWITHEEEHATGLIKAISRVLATCKSSTEKESITLAGKILDNLLQRFRAVHFQFEGGSG